MAMSGSSQADQSWSSGYTFVLASVGAAVGLGNIWKFPYVAGVSGGGAFVLIYLLCVVVVAVPILIAELWIGRRGHSSPPIAMQSVAAESDRSTIWSIVGWMGVAVGFLIATYYSVIAGWTLAYVVKAAGSFGGATAANVAQQFDELQADFATMIFWHSVFMFVALSIVARGLQGGIEKAVKILMPSLFIMLLVMIIYAAVEGDLGAGLSFLFAPDFSQIDAKTFLSAIGQAFFSISVAMGLMMTYGSYLPKSVSITRSAAIVAAADTVVALLAGLMIFPLVFANGLDPASGPGLIFRTLPTAFAGMNGGNIFGALFFILLAFAAVTSIIAIIQPIVAYAEDKWKMRRLTACVIFGLLAWAVGLLSVASFNIWSDAEPLGFVGLFEGLNPYQAIDYITSNLLMPIGGILIALFVGWRVNKLHLLEELSFGNSRLFDIWYWSIRVVVPIAVLGVLLSVI